MKDLNVYKVKVIILNKAKKRKLKAKIQNISVGYSLYTVTKNTKPCYHQGPEGIRSSFFVVCGF